MKRDIKQRIMDLNVSTILAGDTLKNVARKRMENDLLLLQITWRSWLIMKKSLWQN